MKVCYDWCKHSCHTPFWLYKQAAQLTFESRGVASLGPVKVVTVTVLKRWQLKSSKSRNTGEQGQQGQ
jgi:hypothetical protein